MKYSELVNLVESNHLGDPELMIQLEDPSPMQYTGIVRASVYVNDGCRRLINFLPASCLFRKPMEEVAEDSAVSIQPKRWNKWNT